MSKHNEKIEIGKNMICPFCGGEMELNNRIFHTVGGAARHVWAFMCNECRGISAEFSSDAEAIAFKNGYNLRTSEETLNGYQRLAQRTCNITDTAEDKILNGCMGLNGEAGECIDLLKKHRFQGHELDRDHMIEELGDVLWYCAELAAGLGVGLAEVAERNVEKLRKRYPNGFEAERSRER